MSKSSSSSSGFSLFSILTIIFVVLKLCGLITWSWWWVFSPILIQFGLIGLFLLLAGIVGGIVALRS